MHATADAVSEHKITLTLENGQAVKANPVNNRAAVGDFITFISGGEGLPMRIRFLNNSSPFRRGGHVIREIQAAQRRECEVVGDFSFFCELFQDGDWVPYQVNGAGGGVNVGHKKVGP